MRFLNVLQGAAWPPAPPSGHGVVVAGPVFQGLEWVCRGEGALLKPRLSLISGHHQDMLPPSLMNSCSRDRWAHMYSHSMAWLPSHSTVTPSPHLLITVGPNVLELEMASSFTELLEFSGFFSAAQYIYNLTVWMRILDYSFSAPIHIPQRLGPPHPTPCPSILLNICNCKKQRIWHHVLGGSLSRQPFCKCEGPRICIHQQPCD